MQRPAVLPLVQAVSPLYLPFRSPLIYTANFVCFYSHALDGNGTSSCKNGASDVWRLCSRNVSPVGFDASCISCTVLSGLCSACMVDGSSCIRWSIRCAGLGRLGGRLRHLVGVGGRRRAEPDIIGPSQTYDAPGAQSQDDPFTPAPPLPRPHRAPDAFTYSEDHIRRRVRTRGEDQESARSGTGGVDTPDSVDFSYLNCFCMILFSF
jgi:hypothetical protein